MKNLLRKETKLAAFMYLYIRSRSSRSEVFLGKGVLKICSKFTGEHPFLRTPLDGCFCRSSNLVDISLSKTTQM